MLLKGILGKWIFECNNFYKVLVGLVLMVSEEGRRAFLKANSG